MPRLFSHRCLHGVNYLFRSPASGAIRSPWKLPTPFWVRNMGFELHPMPVHLVMSTAASCLATLSG
jgi:hypothetical protein